jgi:hypothetical protein
MFETNVGRFSIFGEKALSSSFQQFVDFYAGSGFLHLVSGRPISRANLLLREWYEVASVSDAPQHSIIRRG